jgi:hypothetical protein
MLSLMLVPLMMSASVLAERDCLTVSANSNLEGDDHRIEFTVSNACDVDIKMDPRLLPWGSPWSVSLAALVRAHPARDLEETGVLFHFSGEDITIPANDLIVGDLSLDGWFEGFRKSLCEADIDVRWSYSFPQSASGKRGFGTIAFEKMNCPLGRRTSIGKQDLVSKVSGLSKESGSPV